MQGRLEARISSWASYYIPLGTTVRHRVSTSDGDHVSLLLVSDKSSGELNLELPAPMVANVIVTLRAAMKDLRALRAPGGEQEDQAASCSADG